ncbi:MAG: hypothetical protein ACI3Z8_04505 [Paludibacteraceae bacterium]
MKTIRSIATIMVCALMVACEQNLPEREPAPAEDNAVQAYIFNNTTDVVIKPVSGDTMSITYGGGTYLSTSPTFPVLFGRNVATDSLTLRLIVAGDVDMFDMEQSLFFAAGETIDTLWVTPLFGYGESAELAFAIPEGMQTTYAPASASITVSADYTWLPAGSVTFSSEWEGTSGVVPIEQAKEFTAEDGSMLFRLNSPYYIIAPKWCTVPGLHLKFYLNADYSAKGLAMELNEVENTGYNWIFWADPFIGPYEQFVSESNQYALVCLWTTTTTPTTSDLYGPVTESWVWTDGYPGELSNPTEGDGEWQEVVFTSAHIQEEAGAVHEILDELAYTTDEYVFPDSYVEHSIFTLTFTNPLGAAMQLQLVGDELAGEYTFGSLGEPVWDNPISAAGVALVGYVEDGVENGCIIDLTWNKFFLTGGSVVVEETETGGYTVAVDAVSATGVAVSASFEGLIAPLPDEKAARKIVK